MTTNDDQYVPSEDEMRHAYWLTRMLDHHAAVTAAFDRFLARVKRDAWDACYRQMVTAPARGVTVTRESNPYAPERRETP